MCLQFICLAILYGLKEIKDPCDARVPGDVFAGLLQPLRLRCQETAVVFPFFMASLAIIRKAMCWMFTEEELKQLDGHPAEDPDEARCRECEIPPIWNSFGAPDPPGPPGPAAGGGAGAGEARPLEPGANEGASRARHCTSLLLLRLHLLAAS
ncbi:Slc4a1 [Symbiodinium sp. CCMP2456]|nr:Slc4a1 [Symbiodinium sp. CCMP2456]